MTLHSKRRRSVPLLPRSEQNSKVRKKGGQGYTSFSMHSKRRKVRKMNESRRKGMEGCCGAGLRGEGGKRKPPGSFSKEGGSASSTYLHVRDYYSYLSSGLKSRQGVGAKNPQQAERKKVIPVHPRARPHIKGVRNLNACGNKLTPIFEAGTCPGGGREERRRQVNFLAV